LAAFDSSTPLDYSPARQRLILARPAGSTEKPHLVVVSDWRAALDDPASLDTGGEGQIYASMVCLSV
jgi:hypothetical protein